jgi:hypothetical protein
MVENSIKYTTKNVKPPLDHKNQRYEDRIVLGDIRYR